MMTLKEDHPALVRQAFMLATDNQFVTNEENRIAHRQLFWYFTQNQAQFNEVPNFLWHEHPYHIYNLQSGINFGGKPGTGKTTVMKVWMNLVKNTHLSFAFRKCRDVAAHYEAGHQLEADLKSSVLYDDLGSEPYESKPNYGTKKRVMYEIIRMRFDIWLENPEIKTHFTHNLTKSELIYKYGQDGYSRLMQMGNPVAIKPLPDGSNTDWRQRTRAVPMGGLVFPLIYDFERIKDVVKPTPQQEIELAKIRENSPLSANEIEDAKQLFKTVYNIPDTEAKKVEEPTTEPQPKPRNKRKTDGNKNSKKTAARLEKSA